MKKYLINLIKDKNKLSYIIIFFVAIFVCIPMCSPKMDIAGDDGIQHICRLIGTYDTMKEGKIFPVIFDNFCNGFGYSWNLFYSPITAYAPLIFRLVTSSFVTILKLTMFSTIFLSGIFSFKLANKIFRNHKVAILTAILYMSAPYHLTDLYSRKALAELASFVFLPIVFSGMYDLVYKKNKKPYALILGAIGLILSHNVMAMYTAIFCFIYLCLHYKKLRQPKLIIKIIVSVIIILLCTSFYWIPLLEHMLATTYEVFIPNRMYSDETIKDSKLTVSNLLFTTKYDMNFHIGLIAIGVIFTIFYWKSIPKRFKRNLKIFTIFGIVSIIMTLKIFPYEKLPDILKMIQFTWRMQEFSILFLSIVAGYRNSYFYAKKAKIRILYSYFSCSMYMY